MKVNLLLAALGVVCSAAPVFAMDENSVSVAPAEITAQVLRSYLGFTTDKSWCIREYKSKNMEFAVAPRDFLGKKLTEAVPLSDTDKKALEHGFKRARKKNKTREVPYAIADAKFLAAIKYIKDKEQFSVRVTQVNPPTAF